MYIVHTCTCTLQYVHCTCTCISILSPQAVAHVTAWQSKTDSINCWSLLAHIWRREEMDMGLPREDKGTLVGNNYC